MGGDSPIFDVGGRGDEFLRDALVMGCRATGHAGTEKHPPIVAYSADHERFVLYWHDDDRAAPLPARMQPEQMVPMISAWLSGTADYGTQPDHDGDNGKGWRVFTGSWGKVKTVDAGPYVSKAAVDSVAVTLMLAEPEAQVIARASGCTDIDRLANRIATNAFGAARRERPSMDYGSYSFLAVEPRWECYGK